MEKTISITLNGLIFNIEEEAYAKLDNYLESIRAHYGKDESREILLDIESSIAEKFLSKTKNAKKVITENDVEDIIKVMGTVEEFDGEETPGAGTGEAKKEEDKTFSLGKRLYRNPDDVVIAGVCSGIASYFGVDPVLVRIIFVVLVFLSGFGILAYIICWIVMPEAKTNSQKLEMQGEPVNIKKLEETIKEKAKVAKEEGRAALGRITTNKGILRRIINFPIQILRAVMQFLIKVLSLGWPIIRIFFGVIIIIAAAVSILGLTAASGVLLFNINSPYIVSDLPLDILISSVMYYVGVVAVYFLAVIPLLFLFLLGLSLGRGKNSFRALASGLLVGIWILAVAAAIVAAGDLAPKIFSRMDEQATTENITRSYDYDDFTKLYLGANMDVKVKPGDEFKIEMAGREKDLDRLNFNIEDGQLQIVQKTAGEAGKLCLFCFNKKIEAEIIVPDLKSFVSFRSVQAELDNFPGLEKLSVGESSRVKVNTSGGNLEIYVAGAGSNLELMGSPENIDAVLEGFGRLVADDLKAQNIKINGGVVSRTYLKGQAEELVVEMTGSSDLFAKDLKAETAKIKVSDNAKAEVYADKTLEAIAQGHGRIYYKGDPEMTVKEISGGKVKELEDFDFETVSREDEKLKIVFKSDTYSPIMSSIRGIELEPSIKLDDVIRYDWSTNFGYLVDNLDNPVYVNNLVNDGNRVYWTFLGDEGRKETDSPIFIYLKAKNEDGDTVSQAELELDWQKPGMVEVIK
ncbi:MAG: DUF2807 domain-containing protein [Patescibacteria group bacterium]|nr:DUF2807 domain-containing protein [Patescibacteria group bacterium]MDD5294993.1 DUF2807 domain-containing protein [Patescibacteria group bacterium]MDD5554358.1 DUF2807 domain-containing protein [Patescibacteria group bacterium]